MSIEKWMTDSTSSLKNKKIAVTGTTGGIGRALCSYLASLGAYLVLLDRDPARSGAFASELRCKYGVLVDTMTLDLEDMGQVVRASNLLKSADIDIFIHNAGAYSIPRHKCSSGYDNVFQINFVSPYYIIREILPYLQNKNGKAVIVGSTAHNYSKTDKDDIDFSTRNASSKVYGNSKRWLMCSAYALIKDENASISVTHPGISFTGITAHYPKPVFALIKHPMKIIFMRPSKACLSVVRGVFDDTSYLEWIGPCVFDVWGFPKKKKLGTIKEHEISFVSEYSEQMYRELKRKFGGNV